ncbi:MAG: SOS response-associated peptidase [Chloroflexota bacterium]
MCGRFTLTADGNAVQLALGLDSTPDLKPRYNIAPSQPLAIITNDQPEQISYHSWGMVPHWAKDPNIAYKMINARSETAHQKPSFRDPFKYRRCLIPADGYYEWKVTDKKNKTPMYIFLNEHKLFAFAGLWEVWHAPDGSEIRSATILTTDSNEKTKDIHHRMPVILQPEDYTTWLQSDNETAKRALMKPFPSDAMDVYPVSTVVNKPANDSPENIVPVEDGGMQQLGLF